MKININNSAGCGLTKRNYLEIIYICVSFMVMFIFFIILEAKFLNLYSLSKWNFNIFSKWAYLTVFILYILLVIILNFLNINGRKVAMLLASFLFSIILYGRLSWILFILPFPFYILTFIKINKFLKIILLIFLSQIFIILVIQVLPNYDYLFWLAYIFSNLFFLRFVLYFYHSLRINFKPQPFLDYCLYILCPVYFIVFPSVVILPKYEYFKESLVYDKDFIYVSKTGLKFFFIGLLQLVLLTIVDYVLTKYPRIHLYINENIVINLLFCFFGFVLIVTSYGNLLFGLIRGIGYNIKSPFRNPFISKNLIDFFERTLGYFKDYIVTIFLVPISMIMRSLNKYLVTFISTIGAVCLGVTLHSLLSLGLQFCALVNNNIAGPSNVITAYLEQLGSELSIFGFYSAIFLIAKNAFLLGGLLAIQLCFNQVINSVSLKKKLILNNLVFKSIQYFIMLVTVYIMTGPHDSLN